MEPEPHTDDNDNSSSCPSKGHRFDTFARLNCDFCAAAMAAERMQYLLGQCGGAAVETHDLFCEMLELAPDGAGSDGESTSAGTGTSVGGAGNGGGSGTGAPCWSESARWIKFEEDVEEGGDRWSKPHVATLRLQSLFELRSYLQNGVTLLDVQAATFDALADAVLDRLTSSRRLRAAELESVRTALHLRQAHLSERGRMNLQHSLVMPILRSLAEISKKHASASAVDGAENGTEQNAGPTVDDGAECSDAGNAQQKSYDCHFMRKLPAGSEAANILVGDVADLQNPVAVFVRLADAVLYAGLTEVPLATRFLFILFGPLHRAQEQREVGRCMGALMSDIVFREVAYRAQSQDDLLIGIDEFLGNVTVLPPGEWDPTIRIEPPPTIPSQDARKTGATFNQNGTLANGNIRNSIPKNKTAKKLDPSLVQSGRLFGGLANDVKAKLPWYISDFRDAFDMKCLAAIIFLYFAALSPVITFGAMLRNSTGAYMATVENIFSAAICGAIYALFSGQPLTLLSSTGPVVIFDKIVYQFSKSYNLDFLAFRFWIGLWSSIVLLLLVAFDVSAYVRYITRFTEETFACLISLIFIWEALMKVCEVRDSSDVPVSSNWTDRIGNGSNMSGIERPTVGDDGVEERAAAYLSILLFLGTFLVSWNLRKFDKSRFFAHRARSLVADFSVVIAIVIMTVIDALVGSNVEKMDVPHTFTPTNPNRNWLVDPFRLDALWMVAAILPAMLFVILIFMDQQITSVIVNRKQNKLRKGCGYHLDLLIIAVLTAFCGLLGLPTYVAATVLSINHVMSLKRTSKCAAPGEVPKFLGCREQRVTALVISLLIGLSVLLTSVLKYIPMPVLYGVFLYMGLSSLEDLDLIRRLGILLMPAKYQPDLLFLRLILKAMRKVKVLDRHVPMRRVHLFTLIQVICLVSMWALKSIEVVSIGFPITVLAMCFVRKSMDFIFTQQELKWLDNIIPSLPKDSDAKKDDMDDNCSDNDTKMGTYEFGSTSTVSSVTMPTAMQKSIAANQQNGATTNYFYNINITDQVTKTTIWRQLSALANRDKRIEPERRCSFIDALKLDKRKDSRENSKTNQPRTSGDSLMTRVLQARRKTFAGDQLIEHVDLNKLRRVGKAVTPPSTSFALDKKCAAVIHEQPECVSADKSQSPSPGADTDRRGSTHSQTFLEGVKVSAKSIAVSGKNRFIKKTKSFKKSIQFSDTFETPQIVVDPPSELDKLNELAADQQAEKDSS